MHACKRTRAQKQEKNRSRVSKASCVYVSHIKLSHACVQGLMFSPQGKINGADAGADAGEAARRSGNTTRHSIKLEERTHALEVHTPLGPKHADLIYVFGEFL